MGKIFIKKLEPVTKLDKSGFVCNVNNTGITVLDTTNTHFFRRYPGNYLNKTVMFLDRREDRSVDAFSFLGITHDTNESNPFFKYGFTSERRIRTPEDILGFKGCDSTCDALLVFWNDNYLIRSNLYKWGLHFNEWGVIYNSPNNLIEKAPKDSSQIVGIFNTCNFTWALRETDKDILEFIFNRLGVLKNSDK